MAAEHYCTPYNTIPRFLGELSATEGAGKARHLQTSAIHPTQIPEADPAVCDGDLVRRMAVPCISTRAL